jgi:CHAD domain-containing protein
MPSSELSLLLHRALEPRLGRLLELGRMEGWQQDPEALHQVRVASRRVRAVLDLVDPAAYPGFRRHVRQLKRLTKALGATRELDVHLRILESFKELDENPVHEALVEHVQEILERRRRKLLAPLKGELASISFENLPGLISEAVLPSLEVTTERSRDVWQCLESPVRRLQDYLPSLMDQENPEAMHRLRIQVKTLRYALEILEAAFPAPLEYWLQRLKAIQMALGEHHDLALLESLLWKVHGRLTQNQRAVLATAALDLLGIVAEERRERFERFCNFGKELSEAMLFFNLRRMLMPQAPVPDGEIP